MKTMLVFFGVLATVLASSQIVSVALVTYGLKPHGDRLLSMLGCVIWIAVAVGCLRGAILLSEKDGE